MSLLRHAAAAALREDRRARADVRARRVVRAGPAIAIEAHVADPHACDAAVLDERLRGRESRKHVDAERLGARGEERRELAERDDHVAAIVHLRRRRQARARRSW